MNDFSIGLLRKLSPVELTENDISALSVICDRVIEVNSKINITSVSDETGIVLRHIVDSLSLLGMNELRESVSPKVCDIGCGGGFPGLPLKAVRGDLRLSMIDSTAKKLKTVEETARMLSFDEISFYPARAEELTRVGAHREKYDFALARAVSALNLLCELCLPFVATGGYFYAMKSQKAEEELAFARNAISVLGGKLVDIREVKFQSDEILAKIPAVPSSDELEKLREFCLARHCVVVIKKISKTSGIYPRAFAAISKKPL